MFELITWEELVGCLKCKTFGLRVADGNSNYYCWVLVTTSRHDNGSASVRIIVASEAASTMTAASIVVRHSNPSHSIDVITHAKRLNGGHGGCSQGGVAVSAL